MKVLITGNSGYIGSHLTQLLLEKTNYTVHGVDVAHPKAWLHRHHAMDIRYTQPRTKYDCIIHLAGLVRVNESVRDPLSYYTTNVAGTANLLKTDTKNFIFASTGAAHAPTSPYALSKRMAEDVVRASRNGKDHSIFRFYNVVGKCPYAPTNTDGLMYNLMEAQRLNKPITIHGEDYETRDGTAQRNYVHVNEVCHALMQAIEQPANSAYENLGRQHGHTVAEVVDAYNRANGCDVPVVYGPRREGDISCSTMDKVSDYMQELYGIDEMMRD